MNSVVRIGLSRFFATATNSLKYSRPPLTRAVWHMSSKTTTSTRPATHSSLCSCGCMRYLHTNGEKELVEFLKEEIGAEKRAHKMKSLPKELDGFAIKVDGADMELKKESGDETITVSLNVNHSVDMDSEPEIDPNADKPDLGDLKSKPNFEVEIHRGGTTLHFNCSYIDRASGENDEGYSDSYGIDEVSIFEGDWTDKIYSVAGDVLDGNLYDLFMTILEEKGISSEFADKLCEVATSHEHASYINLLEKLSKFASGK